MHLRSPFNWPTPATLEQEVSVDFHLTLYNLGNNLSLVLIKLVQSLAKGSCESQPEDDHLISRLPITYTKFYNIFILILASLVKMNYCYNNNDNNIKFLKTHHTKNLNTFYSKIS